MKTKQKKEEPDYARFKALTKGCRLMRRLFAKPAFIQIVLYLTRANLKLGFRQYKTQEEIAEEVCKISRIDRDPITIGVLDMLVEDGWIKKHPMKHKGAPVYYENTRQGDYLSIFLAYPEISKLFKP